VRNFNKQVIPLNSGPYEKTVQTNLIIATCVNESCCRRSISFGVGFKPLLPISKKEC